MMNHRPSNWSLFFNYIFIPVVVILVTYQSNFIHGFIDHLEAGKELACINEILRGRLPYKDIFMPFGPLNVYLEAFFMLLLGKNLAALRGFFYIGTIITLIIGYLIGRNLCRRRFFSYPIALALVIETFHPFWATRWAGFRFGLGLLAILCIIKFFEKEKNIWSFFAGFFVSSAFLTSMDIGILSLVAIGLTLCFYVGYNFLKSKTLNLKGISFFIIGTLVILVPFIFYFALNGAFLSYLNTLIVIAKNHTNVWGHSGIDLNLWEWIRSGQIFTYNFKYILPIFLYTWSIIYIIRRILKKAIGWRGYSILCLTIYGLLMYKLAARAIEGPQFQIALQPAIIIGFVFLEDIFEQIIKLKRKLVANRHFVKFVALVIVFVFMVSYAVFSEKRFYGNLKGWFLYQICKDYLMPMYLEAIPLSKLRLSALTIDRAKGIMVPADQAKEIEGVTEYIVSVTSPDEPLFTFPEHGMYNFFANRPCVGRFNMPAYAWYAPEFRQELLADLKNTKPRYIIYNKNLSYLAKSIQRTKEFLPEIIEYINSNYKKEISFGRTDILRRKE